jgi:hypothetical protein
MFIGWRFARSRAGCHEQELLVMCDYSLHGVRSRPAKVEDKLITTKFWNTTTRGFSAVEEPSVAVCLLPGTEIAFDEEVKRVLTGFQLIFRKRPIVHRVARFRQIDMDNPCTHHDALEFPDGQVVLVTHLREGQRATVLQLPAQAKEQTKQQAEEQARERMSSVI